MTKAQLLFELRKAAQGAAEVLHEQTGAPFVLVVLSDGAALSIMGAWVPTAAFGAKILRHAADSIDSGEAEIVDNRPKGSHGGAS